MRIRVVLRGDDRGGGNEEVVVGRGDQGVEGVKACDECGDDDDDDDDDVDDDDDDDDSGGGSEGNGPVWVMLGDREP